MKTLFKPEHLKAYTRPECYVGRDWYGYYGFLGRSRESSALERANFDAGLAAIGGETGEYDEETQSGGVVVVRENHWAVGWVEWIAIHESCEKALEIADGITGKLDGYPVVDEDLWSQYEEEEAQYIWKNCYKAQDRIDYIRERRSQFDFRSFADMLGCVRGEYFCGYASELIG